MTLDAARAFLQAVLDCLQEYDGAIQAIAAVVVAGLTYFLWRIGREQIKQTKILQRAYISVEPMGPVRIGWMGCWARPIREPRPSPSP